MGGLISRSYQATAGKAHNMVITATPNHGTFGFVHALATDPRYGFLINFLKLWSPGTADLLAYDDRHHILISKNPRLQRLNENPKTSPQADLTLIAGDDTDLFGLLKIPGDDDRVVPVDSVFCRTSSPADGDASLIKAGGSGTKMEHTEGFNHHNFAKNEYRISADPSQTNLLDLIVSRLSDWWVGQKVDDPNTPYDDNGLLSPTVGDSGYIRSRVKVEYNGQGRVYDRIVLVIYVKDGNDNWYVAGGDAKADGTLNSTHSIVGNSIGLATPLIISDSITFIAHGNDPAKQVKDVEIRLIPLNPGQNTVSLIPQNAKYQIP